MNGVTSRAVLIPSIVRVLTSLAITGPGPASSYLDDQLT